MTKIKYDIVDLVLVTQNMFAYLVDSLLMNEQDRLICNSSSIEQGLNFLQTGFMRAKY